MVARRAFVQIERLHARGAPRGQVVGVVVEDAGPRAVGRAVLVGAAGLVALAEGLDLADLEPGARDGREISRGCARRRGGRSRNSRRAAIRGSAARSGGSVRRCSKNWASVPLKPARRRIASISPRIRATSREAEIVDLVGGQRQRRVLLDQPRVEPVAAAACGRGRRRRGRAGRYSFCRKSRSRR